MCIRDRDEGVEVAPHERLARGGRIQRIRGDARNNPKVVAHASLQGLGNATLALLLHGPVHDELEVMREMRQVIELHIVHGFLGIIT